MCAVSGISSSSFLPSRRKPVPPSKTTMALPARSSTQLVFPPIWAVLGPGEGMLPRTPQKVTCIGPRMASRLAAVLERERTSLGARRVFLVHDADERAAVTARRRVVDPGTLLGVLDRVLEHAFEPHRKGRRPRRR